jgi:hypothetical protein
MIWTSMLRGLGPSSSAKRIDWKRPSDSDAPPQQRGPEVRVRVAPLAIRIPGVVVAVTVVLGHQRLDHGLEVLDEGALELVDEERAGRVQRVDEEDAFLDVGAQHDVTNRLGDVEDLGLVLAQHRERLARHLESLHLRLLHHPKHSMKQCSR